MSADALRAAVIAELEKQAGQIAEGLINVSTERSCEQIALYVARLQGAAGALKGAAATINSEYRKLTAPAEEPSKKKRTIQEAY